MKNRTFITIPIQTRYYGRKPYRIGKILKLEKEPENEHDSEAIRVVLPGIDTVGYVANSISTVYSGTISAGRLYDKFEESAYAMVVFITRASVIASLLTEEEVGDREIKELEEAVGTEINLFCTEDEESE